MKRILYISVTFCLFIVSLFCQNTYDWYKTYGGINSDAGRCIIKTSDGGLLSCGFTYLNNTNNSDIFIVKTDIKGNLKWQKSIGNTDYEYGNSIAENKSGNFYLTGSVLQNGNSNLLVMGLTANGDLLWKKSIGGGGNEFGKSIIVTSNYSLLACGYTNSSGSGENDILLTKLDKEGNLIWQKTYGGKASDIGTCVIEGKDGQYYVAGSSGSFSAANRDAIIYKIDTSGAEIWKKNFNINNFDHVTQIIQTSDGGFALCGYSDFHGADLMSFSLWRIDLNGKLIWSKTYDHNGFYDYGRCLVETPDKGFIIAGSSKSKTDNVNHIMFVKTDSLGKAVTQKYIEGEKTNWGNSILLLDNNSVVITGYSNAFGSSGFDMVLFKILIDEATGINSKDRGEKGYNIFRNYPNPFNPSTRIDYSLQNPENVILNIYDTNGSLIKNLVNSYQKSGMHSVEWSGCNNSGDKVCSGTYIVNLRTARSSKSTKIIYAK